MESERLFETGEQTMEQILATCGAANVTEDSEGRQWTIGNAAIRKTLAWRDGAGLCLAALEQRATGYAWRPDLQANKLAGGEFSLSWERSNLSARQATALHGSRRRPKRESVTLQHSTCAWPMNARCHASATALSRRYGRDRAVAGGDPAAAGTLSRVAP
jgi:hypothetical protein